MSYQNLRKALELETTKFIKAYGKKKYGVESVCSAVTAKIPDSLYNDFGWDACLEIVNDTYRNL